MLDGASKEEKEIWFAARGRVYHDQVNGGSGHRASPTAQHLNQLNQTLFCGRIGAKS